MPEKRLTAGRWRPAGGRGGRGGRRPHPPLPPVFLSPPASPSQTPENAPPRPPISPERVVRVSTTSSPHPHASPADTASLEGTTFCSWASFSAAERESPQEPVTPRLRRPPPAFPSSSGVRFSPVQTAHEGSPGPERAPVSGGFTCFKRKSDVSAIMYYFISFQSHQL